MFPLVLTLMTYVVMPVVTPQRRVLRRSPEAW
jgi:hypothetical protein